MLWKLEWGILALGSNRGEEAAPWMMIFIPRSSIMMFALVLMSKAQPKAQFTTWHPGDYQLGGGTGNPYGDYSPSGRLTWPTNSRRSPIQPISPPSGFTYNRNLASAKEIEDYSGLNRQGGGGIPLPNVCNARSAVAGPCRAAFPRWTYSVSMYTKYLKWSCK